MSAQAEDQWDDIIVIPDEHLARATPGEREQYRLYLVEQAVKRDQWEAILPAVAPGYADKPFADHHVEFWRWVWSIEADKRPPPFVGIWPRGGAKSTSAEMAAMMLGARGKRRYCLYISETQDQADDHVANIASLLESDEVGLAYPEVGQRLMNKYGSSKGWRRNRIRAGNGFTVDAIGLDSAGRGVKLEDMRPDLIILDDIDGEHDTPAATEKKIKTITRKLLPAGDSTRMAVIAIQNMVHEDSIFARFVEDHENPADFLRNRIVVGPIPAVYNMEWEERDGEWVITGGEPSWPGGQNLDTCQGQMNDWGLSAFMAEAQHQAVQVGGGIFDHLTWASYHVTWAQVPELKRVAVWLDPAVTSTDTSDSQGIIADGLGSDKLMYRLFAWEGRTTPMAAMKRALMKAIELGADTVGVETDQGGDTWKTVYLQACEELREEDHPDGGKWLEGSAPRYAEEKAGAGHGGKMIRAQRMLVDYERNKIRHVIGTHTVLEQALNRFPKIKPFDLVDAAYWGWRDVMHGRRKRSRAKSAAGRSIGPMQPRR